MAALTPGNVEFICLGCGAQVKDFRWVNYRTIPPSMDTRDLCPDCKKREEKKPMVETRINVPGFSLDKNTWGDVPNNETMAAKYFLDIYNDGTPEMKEGMRKILKAMWMRLAMPENPTISDADLGEAVGEWYRTVSPMPAPTDVKVVTQG